LIKGKELYIYGTGTFVNSGRYPVHQAVVRQEDVGFVGYLVFPISAVRK
jgi:hypothetical protein